MGQQPGEARRRRGELEGGLAVDGAVALEHRRPAAAAAAEEGERRDGDENAGPDAAHPPVGQHTIEEQLGERVRPQLGQRAAVGR